MHDGSLHRKLVWLAFFRLVMVTVLLGGTALMSFDASEAGNAAAASLYQLVGITYALSFVLAVALRQRWRPRLVAYAQIAVDAATAGAVVALTGRADSVFVFLFSIAIVNGAILLFRRGAAMAAALALGTYLAVALGGSAGAGPEWQRVFAHAVAFVLTAALAAYLAEQLRSAGERLAEREVDLAAMKVLHESIVQSVSSGLVTLDREGRITFLNRAAEQVTGLTLEAIRGDPVDRWFGTFREIAPRGEVDYQNVRGERLRVGYTTFPLRNPDGVDIGRAVIFQDLTALRAMEDVVRRSERLADLGSMAAGLAHEVRNPLAAVTGSIELLTGSARLSAEDRRLMEIVLREAGRLEDLVRRFLQFTRPGPPARAPVDLSAVTAETLDVFANDPLGRGVDVERALEPVVVPCDGDQVRQVLWNLLANAAQAVAAGGSAAPPQGRRGVVRVSCGPDPAGGARLAVADDGPGIAAADLRRIFTPFFTTKREGTGLGLPTVHRIVEAHGGTLAVASREGEGATFVVRLPGDPSGGRAAVSG
jgi:two-component system sensor histidine kinase PilS (NtrC family)